MNRTDGSERAAAEARTEGLLGGFFRFSDHTFVDYATEAYLAVVCLMILFFYGGAYRGEAWRGHFLLAANLAFLVGVQALVRAYARWPENRLVDFIRHLYPIPLYVGLYCQVGELNRMFVAGYADPFFQRLEERLFGCQPALAFMEKLPYLAVSELFYMSYFSYYVMIAGLGVLFYFRDRELFWHYVSIVSFVFYVCFFIFILLPVAGPYLNCSLPYPAAVQRGPFFQVMKFIYAHFETPGGAFPSSHVAVALCTLYFSWRYLRRLRWVHAPVVALLCAATVYCRYHYLVDVFGGMLTAAALIPLGEWLYRKAGGASRAATVEDALPRRGAKGAM